uniref:Uncharacterized protein n=1 Tax=Arsenophonus endosymbiont of Trialeurodes vaporariorum TaxID=235567 RepID=A0A3B0MEK9_9GAMM
MGQLIPLCRFCLLVDEGLHYSDGIAQASHKEGMFDPSIAIDFSGKEVKVRWANPEKRPWRELTGLLSFIGQQKSPFDCIQLRLAISKALRQREDVAIWSGGLRVSSNAGEQYVSGFDDMVESLCWLNLDAFGKIWFDLLKIEMSELDKVAKILYGCVMSYAKELSIDGGNYAKRATHLFWQLCERQAQQLLDNCDKPDIRHQLRCQFARYSE